MGGMKVAKATERDFEAAYKLINLLNCVCDYDIFPDPLPEGRTDAMFDEFVHEDLEEFYRRAKDAYNSGSLRRVVFGFETAINNACDPDADTLEFAPWIVRAKEEAKLVPELVTALQAALPHIECNTVEQSGIITFCGELLDKITSGQAAGQEGGEAGNE